jgi:hypothetical protein
LTEPDPKLVDEIRRDVRELKAVLNEASKWCKHKFFERFIGLKCARDIAEVVYDANKDLTNDGLGQQYADEISEYVQNVYEISQYAAIRSLTPHLLELEEVEGICNRLHNLVDVDIIKSGLDGFHPELPNHPINKTLTREYSLGQSNTNTYPDDAYYPLLLRSLSGLLSRTLDHLSAKDAVRAGRLTLAFRGFLNGHFDNLVRRRPLSDKYKDHLWSFQHKGPYVFYATQRTMFALLAYKEFLIELDNYEVGSGSEDLETKIREALAKGLVDAIFTGNVAKFIVEAAKRSLGPQLPAEPPVDDPKKRFLIADPAWLAGAFQNWAVQFANDLRERVLALLEFEQYVELIPEFRNIANVLHERMRKMFVDKHGAKLLEYDPTLPRERLKEIVLEARLGKFVDINGFIGDIKQAKEDLQALKAQIPDTKLPESKPDGAKGHIAETKQGETKVKKK